MRGRQIEAAIPACPLSQASSGVVIFRDFFMLKMLKNGFVSFGKQERSPEAASLSALLCYQASIMPRRVS